MLENNYDTTRSKVLGLPEGTGKRYSEEDLLGFIEASPEIPRNPFAEILHEAAARYRALMNEPNMVRRKQAAVGILEDLLISYVREVAPEDLSSEKNEGTQSFMRLPTYRPLIGNQQKVEFLKGLLGGTDMSREEGESLLNKSSTN